MNSKLLLEAVTSQLRAQGIAASYEIDPTQGVLRAGSAEVVIRRHGLSEEGTADNLLIRALVTSLALKVQPEDKINDNNAVVQ